MRRMQLGRKLRLCNRHRFVRRQFGEGRTAGTTPTGAAVADHVTGADATRHDARAHVLRCVGVAQQDAPSLLGCVMLGFLDKRCDESRATTLFALRFTKRVDQSRTVYVRLDHLRSAHARVDTARSAQVRGNDARNRRRHRRRTLMSVGVRHVIAVDHAHAVALAGAHKPVLDRCEMQILSSAAHAARARPRTLECWSLPP